MRLWLLAAEAANCNTDGTEAENSDRSWLRNSRCIRSGVQGPSPGPPTAGTRLADRHLEERGQGSGVATVRGIATGCERPGENDLTGSCSVVTRNSSVHSYVATEGTEGR